MLEQKTNAKYVLDRMGERELLKSVHHNGDGKSYERRLVSPHLSGKGLRQLALQEYS